MVGFEGGGSVVWLDLSEAEMGWLVGFGDLMVVLCRWELLLGGYGRCGLLVCSMVLVTGLHLCRLVGGLVVL